ncbi:MAG TPA: hypothetical protein VGZ90_14980 [Puia sp.]|jgi:hypothetical protein|nr:hypothetical protein [Puia sp.]
MILNESALKTMKFKEPIGQTMTDGDIKFRIEGGKGWLNVAWWFMKTWLKNYPYRVSIHWWIFALAGAMSFLFALGTISYQAIRTVVANPVNNLRSE